MGEPTKTPGSAGGSTMPRTTRDKTVGSSSTTSTPSSAGELRTPSSAGELTTAAGSSERRFKSSVSDVDRPSDTGDGGNGGLLGRVRERAGAQLATQKDRATDGLGTIARAVRRTTQELRQEQQNTAADYVERAADQLERFSERLKTTDVGALVRDAANFARRRPAVFVGSAFVVGLVAARFFKSSPSGNGEATPAWQRLRDERTGRGPGYGGPAADMERV